ncbi:MAG TPA: c-type cytochrome [Longimicrobiales bacterium]|nr:c-type cytochrome [Longimicrobiales bacterium]
MSEQHGHHDEHHEGHHPNYKKIYFTLLILLVVSVVGPFLEILWVTLITAFGIAIVKANLVIQNFMHLKWEKRIMKWMLTTSLVLMALMVAGISSDVLNHEGRNWVNIAAQAAVERGIEGGEAEAEAEVEAEPVEVGFSATSTFNIVCASCHGTAGDGTGAAGAALDPRPANFTDPAFWEERDMERIVTVIRDGATAVGGSPLMVGWSASFDQEQIQQLADYVASFRPN